jgi:hypothetical protein
LSENEHYFFYPGTVFWGQNKPNSKDEIPPSPSHVLKKVDGLWKYHKTYDDVLFWGARNFETFENKVVVGDGNEIGPDGLTGMEILIMVKFIVKVKLTGLK